MVGFVVLDDDILDTVERVVLRFVAVTRYVVANEVCIDKQSYVSECGGGNLIGVHVFYGLIVVCVPVLQDCKCLVR